MMTKLLRALPAMLLAHLLIFALPLSAAGEAASNEAASGGAAEPIPEPDWFKISFLELEADVEEAAADGKRVMLYFYQDGCPYCLKLIKDNFGRDDIASYTQTHFDTIALNLWGDREVTDLSGLRTTEKQFAKDMDVQFTPTLLILDESGDVAVRMNGLYPPDKFLRALQWGSEKSASDEGFQDALLGKKAEPAVQTERAVANVTGPVPELDKLVRDPERHLLVLFEEPSCEDCDVLHNDIFTRPRVSQLLEDYHVAVLDATSDDALVTPEGEETTSREWAEELGIVYRPSLVFFDRTSREVFRTEAWLRAFHIEGALAYVAQDAYLETPQFQRFLEDRGDSLRARGIDTDLMQ